MIYLTDFLYIYFVTLLRFVISKIITNFLRSCNIQEFLITNIIIIIDVSLLRHPNPVLSLDDRNTVWELDVPW